MADRSAAARRAWMTRRQRGPKQQFELRSTEAHVLQRASLTARSVVARAKRIGIPVDVEWMMDAPARISEQGYRCALTRIPFDVDYRTDGAGGTHLGPSPDRIEPALGYIPGNVRWVLWAVNRAKGEMPEELFLRICCAIADNRRSP